MKSRRTLIVAALFAALAAACAGGSPADPVTSEDVSIGDPNAPVKVVEYASLACPFCARHNNTVWKGFKEKFIDTGQVYFTSREMLVHDANFAAAGFLTARCAGKDKYFDVVDEIYQNQVELTTSGQVREGLQRIARRHGVSKDQFTACVENGEAVAAMKARYQTYFDQGFHSTPTFVVNGRELELPNLPTLADWEKVINDAKAAPAAPAPAAAPAASPAP